MERLQGNWPRLLRLLIGTLGGFWLARLAVALGLSLPLPTAEGLLTAGLFGCAIYLPLLCWSLGASGLMRFSAGALWSGALAVAAILLLPLP